MSIEDPELLAEFVVESLEHLEEAENELLRIESQKDGVDPDLVNRVFRAVHSIKGAAGFLGQETLESLAHREEEVLNRLRTGAIRPTNQVITTLLAATDRLKGLLDTIENSNGADISEHLTALETLLNGDPDGSEQPAAEPRRPSPQAATQAAHDPIPGSTAERLPEPESDQRATAPRPAGISLEALREFLVESTDNLEQIDRDLIALERESDNEALLNSIFRSIHTLKGSAGFLAFGELERLAHAAENLLGKMRAGEVRLNESISNLLFATIDLLQQYLQNIEREGSEGEANADHLLDKLRSACEDGIADEADPSRPVSPNRISSDPQVSNHVPPTGSEPPTQDANPTAVAVPSSDEPAMKSAAESTIRVDVALLDQLMTRVGELVLARNQILQFTSSLADSELLNTSQRLNLITTELQEGVMKTRMQPIGNVWSKFPRIVRDLAYQCEKKVRIEMQGKDTELDKTILEAIKDPLTHLIRNSVDHGIEAPSVRRDAGKPEEGCLRLYAFHEGGQVIIEISDDGAGLNPEKIKAKACQKNLITREQAERMPDHEVGELIFLPGFSTADKVSNVSGRGVGMDVVRTNIEKIGGMVDIQSQSGSGTTIRIKIPLTLAIIPALTITNDGDRFAIPQVNVRELVRLDKEQSADTIEWIQGAPVYRLRGRLLPLVYLRTLLGTKPTQEATPDAVNIVVLRADDRQFGLVVDHIKDTEEIVVKPLSKQLKSIPVYSGTTIMGDGRVALILDVLGLATESNVLSKEGNASLGEATNRISETQGEQQSFVILGTRSGQRLALPISQVARLEKLDRATVERTNSQQVVQYRGEILPLIDLAVALGMEHTLDTDNTELTVVVYKEASRSVGLIVDRIVDIVETTLEMTCKSGCRGLLGSAVIQERVTDLVDLPAVTRQVAILN